MTRFGVSSRPSRAGLSPANAISVRTAASASSREGSGATGSGAARNGDDGSFLMMASIRSLWSLRSTGAAARVPDTGGVTGAPAPAQLLPTAGPLDAELLNVHGRSAKRQPASKGLFPPVDGTLYNPRSG